jgi:hypothetical protein
MIWISSNNYECEDYYFEPRDFDMSRRGSDVKARVSGLVGNGSAEFSCEIALGQKDSVTIFPIWTEQGVEPLPSHLESQELRQTLLTHVRELLSLPGSWQQPLH